jgi:uncharacterized membrane protein
MSKTKKSNLFLRISIIFGLIGFLDSLYLFYSELTGRFFCPIQVGMFECETVNTSKFAKLLGVHVSLWGMLFYLLVIVIMFLSLYTKNDYWLSFFLPVAGLWGFLFSVYLTAIELFVIKKLCEFCLLSAICTTIIFILVIFAKRLVFPSLFSKLDFWNMFKNKNELENQP